MTNAIHDDTNALMETGDGLSFTGTSDIRGRAKPALTLPGRT
ncbi:hypothetical protein [Arthrobacter globiformis]|nr:hypothetical protein [Arthrobacter globiformis]MDQ0867506.1 hypothetical protein [Arthrobacter globiformis]